MQAEAIAKVKAEMKSNDKNPYIQFVGDFLLRHLEANPDDAAKIMTADKTIGKSLDEMRKVAEKQKVNNVAVLTPDEGFAVVLKYFGIGEPDAAAGPSQEELDAELAALLE